MSETSIATYKGKLFDFMKPKPEDICIEDIAHALALTNRFNGHTIVPYSVAEHCVRMSQPYMPGNPLINLLHDAAEAYIGDIPRPQKDDLGWKHFGEFLLYRNIEDTLLVEIYDGLGLEYLHNSRTKEADNIMLVTEVRDLMPQLSIYDSLFEEYTPLPNPIIPWNWELAEEMYLKRFEELTK